MSELFSQRVVVADDVLIRELDGESVILDSTNENYFGLDEIGTRMWQILVSANTIKDAYDALLQEYEVEPQQLRQDLAELVAMLLENRLIVLVNDDEA